MGDLAPLICVGRLNKQWYYLQWVLINGLNRDVVTSRKISRKRCILMLSERYLNRSRPTRVCVVITERAGATIFVGTFDGIPVS